MSEPLHPLGSHFDMEFREMQETVRLLQRQIQASLGIPAHYFQPPLSMGITFADAVKEYYRRKELRAWLEKSEGDGS